MTKTHDSLYIYVYPIISNKISDFFGMGFWFLNFCHKAPDWFSHVTQCTHAWFSDALAVFYCIMTYSYMWFEFTHPTPIRWAMLGKINRFKGRIHVYGTCQTWAEMFWKYTLGSEEHILFVWCSRCFSVTYLRTWCALFGKQYPIYWVASVVTANVRGISRANW